MTARKPAWWRIHLFGGKITIYRNSAYAFNIHVGGFFFGVESKSMRASTREYLKRRTEELPEDIRGICPWCSSNAYHENHVKRMYWCVRCQRGGAFADEEWQDRKTATGGRR